MRLHICAVGRLRGGPEKALVDDYLTRCGRTGRALGLGPATLTEIDDRKASGKSAEAEALLRAVPEGAVLCALDERGVTMASPDFAARLGRWRDDGAQDAAFLIGGADGLDPAVLDRADLALSFGAMVWPHMLARVMLAEQLYRATGILAGTPYHRA
jgi:23S rRNA (pseudouridine1915-N3)-methyltransferase